MNKKIPRSVIYVYRGTFDPFHNNHAAISRWCLSQAHTEKLVIHINYRQEYERKQPVSWEIRYAIIQQVLHMHSSIEIRRQERFDETLEWLTNTYGSDADIVQVLGSDVIEEVKDKPQITAYAQHVRIATGVNDLIYSTTLHNKPLVPIPLDLPSISSTQIRSCLLERRLDDVAQMLSKEAMDYIQSINDYSPLFLSIRKLRKNNLFIPDNLAQKLSTFFGIHSYLEDKTQQFKGKSGDAIFSVMHENKIIAICKSFKLGSEACRVEVEKHRLIAHYSETPSIYFTDEHLVAMEYIDGRPPYSVNDYTLIGNAYFDLHEKGLISSDTNCDVTSSELLALKDNFSIHCRTILNPLLKEHILNIFAELLNSYKNAPHQRTIIHGDAQPGNVLIKEGSVVFIDFGKVKQGQDRARDINQMIASIYWKAWQDNRTTEGDVCIIKEQVKAFEKGYSYIKTTASDQLWSFYWIVRSFILTQEEPELALSEYLRSELDNVLNPHLMNSNINRFFSSEVKNTLSDARLLPSRQNNNF